MAHSYFKNWHKKIVIIIGITFLFSLNAYAATTGTMPFNTAIQNFQTNFIAWIFAAAVILWIATCLMLAFGDWGDGMKRIINIVFWLSLALSGTMGVSAFFSAGAVF